MQRRSFLSLMVNAGVAPAIVRASSLMPIKPLPPLAWNLTPFYRMASGLRVAMLVVEERRWAQLAWNPNSHPIKDGPYTFAPGKMLALSRELKSLAGIWWTGELYFPQKRVPGLNPPLPQWVRVVTID